MEMRLKAVDDFKAGKKDVLVATDVASKGDLFSTREYTDDEPIVIQAWTSPTCNT